MVREIKTYKDGTISTSYHPQTVEDKNAMINDNNKIIRDMRNRLKTETNPKIIERCCQIIEDRTESNKRLRQDIIIISNNHRSNLCVSPRARQRGE